MRRMLIIILLLISGSIVTLSNSGCKSKENLINLLVVWGGEELESFRAMIKPFEDSTGFKVNIEATRDINAVLVTRLEAGNPPDMANLPNPGVLKEFAREKKILPLDNFVDTNRLLNEYGKYWVELGSYDGRLYGIFIKASLKSLIWYAPKNLANFCKEPPKTWDELMTLTEKISQAGKIPWSIGLESGSASGWPGTDWIEDILLRSAGEEIYDKWINHEISWLHPAIKTAWQIFGKIVRNKNYLYGGTNGTIATNFGDAINPLFTSPPGAYLHRQAIFIQGFIHTQFPDLIPEKDFSFFSFPPIKSNRPNPMIVAADLFVVFRDKKPVRALINYLTSARAQEIWVKRGGAIAPNKQVSLESYPDKLSKKAATIFNQTSIFRFDASDMMPASMNNAFCKGVIDYVAGKELDEILKHIENIALESYGR